MTGPHGKTRGRSQQPRADKMSIPSVDLTPRIGSERKRMVGDYEIIA
ncbi:MAG: hypothetical protein P8Y48_05060 [Novosphingobium sp.]